MIRRLGHNLGWKLTSLGLAILLWFAVVGDTQIVTMVSVPIQFKAMPADLELSSDLPEKVELELHGPSRKLSGGATASSVCQLDLSTVTGPGERTFTIEYRQLNLPPGVELARVVPSQVRLRFERRVTRDIAVQLRLAGPQPAGWKIAHYQITPEKVRITGPESRVNQIESAQTDPIDLSSAGEDTEFRPHVFLGNSQVRFDSPSSVRVRIWLEKIPGRAGEPAAR